MYQGVKGAPGVSNCPRGSRWTSGVSKVGVQLSQGVKRGVRGVPGVKGSLGDPKGLRWTSWAYQGVKGAPGLSQRVKENVRGVQGGQQGR